MTVRTAIFKDRVAGVVTIRKLNLAGDQQTDFRVHGGSAMAVYAYPAEHYDYWRKQLRDLSLCWGAFGENLTIDGLSEDALCTGDLLRLGTAVLQVTHPACPVTNLNSDSTATTCQTIPGEWPEWILLFGCQARICWGGINS
jgi:MOSC domain-containing protein YiiM